MPSQRPTVPSPTPNVITAPQLRRFRQIKKAFPHRASLPGPQHWQHLSANAVWHYVFRQVVAVGGATPADKFLHRSDVRKLVSYHRLCRLDSDSQVRRTISGVLRDIGARYARQDWRHCAKTTALGRNLRVLQEFDGGPTGFVRHIAEINGRDKDRRRIEFVGGSLHFIKNKGARDLLTTSFGLLRNGIAFDARVLGALRAIGVHIPPGVPQNAKVYAAFEADLLHHVCRPLRISGAELDQLLFVNYSAIKSLDFRS